MLPTVVLLHDAFASQGRVDASDVLLEAEHIARALAELGFKPEILPVNLDLTALERSLAELAPRVVVNLVESLQGRGQLIHVVPALLESLGVPFTGCSASAQALTSNKLLAKQQLLRAGIPTPALFASRASAGTWIVKSVWEHASLGLDDASVQHGPATASAIANRSAQFGGRWFAEAFVPGRELNVAVIASDHGPLALPVAEICFRDFPPDKPQIVGYAAKWHSDSFEYRNTVRRFLGGSAEDAALAARAREIALACWELFALDGYARIDLRVDGDGAPWVLEVNANPCLSQDAGFAAALAQSGIDFSRAVGWLIDDALRRAGGASAGNETRG